MSTTSSRQQDPDTPAQIDPKYLASCKAGCLYLLRQRLSQFVPKEQVVVIKTPSWRSWWKSLNDPQKGSSFAPPFILVRFQDYALVDHQNVRTMLQSGLMFKKNDHQVTELAMFSIRVSGQLQIIHRDSEAQTQLALTTLLYLQGGAFNFSIHFPGLPTASTCTVGTDDKSFQVPDGLAINSDTDAGDVSSIDLSFYGLFWAAVEKTGPRAITLNLDILQKSESEPSSEPLVLLETSMPVRPPTQ